MIVTVILLLAGAGVVQAARERAFPLPPIEDSSMYVKSGTVVRRLTVSLNALAADLYWIRALQHYGGTRLSSAPEKKYELLYPLLDITTTLDPYFNIAYRFGAILLSEGYPNGPGRPDDAISLLKKGIRESPNKWEYYLDAGFVEYWWRRDTRAAADWFLSGSKLPTAPNWLEPLAASVLAEGGDQVAARVLWTQLAQSAEQEWLRRTARTRLQQLDAEAVIDQLQPVVNSFYDKANRFPTGWEEVIRAGLVRGIPLDPTGIPYTLDPVSGAIDVAKDSTLFPLRRGH